MCALLNYDVFEILSSSIVEDTISYNEALSLLTQYEWLIAMRDELNSVKANQC